MKYILTTILTELDSTLKANEFSRAFGDLFEKHGAQIEREVCVPDRGDGRRGKIDIVAHYKEKTYAIEIDWMSPRKKSIHKIQNYQCDGRFVVLREGKQVLEY